MHKLTDADRDQSLAENPPWSGLTCLERLMPTRVTRHASTVSALLTSTRTDGSMTVENANANPVVPPKRKARVMRGEYAFLHPVSAFQRWQFRAGRPIGRHAS